MTTAPSILDSSTVHLVGTADWIDPFAETLDARTAACRVECRTLRDTAAVLRRNLARSPGTPAH
jgi:hypothetical protein